MRDRGDEGYMYSREDRARAATNWDTGTGSTVARLKKINEPVPSVYPGE